MKKDLKDRNYGIDLVRIIAVILVLCVHFFLNTAYYVTPKSDISMKFQAIIKNFCMICVPLFMLITGYLNNKTEYNKSFFKKLINILIIWFFYSLIEYFALNISKGNLDLKSFILSLTSFRACDYSWYIEMYIGLYLISPVINSAYNSFDKKNRTVLLLIAIIGGTMPEIINNIFSGSIHFPSWWAAIYPLSYYIIGKYISDVKPEVSKKTIIVLLFLTQILIYSYNYISSIEFNSFLTVINSTLIFLLFYKVNVKNNVIRKIIKYISGITLDIYLASSLVDKIIYPIFNNKMSSMGFGQSKLILFAPIVIIVIFIISTIYSSIRKFLINVR